MRVLVLSDLHLEFEPTLPVLQQSDVDLVILAGDIAKGYRAVDFAALTWPDIPVLLVPGNHEYYGGMIPDTFLNMREVAKDSNVKVLDKESFTLSGVRFLCTTLWTGFDLFHKDPAIGMQLARTRIRDFTAIRLSPGIAALEPSIMAALYRESLHWLTEELNKPFSGTTVVVTHHAPSLRSSRPEFSQDPLSCAFISDLEELIEKSDIALWIHGHTHYCCDYVISGTRVLSNQAGYPGEDSGGFGGDLVVEI